MLTASANDTHVVCVTPGHPRGAVTLGLSAGGVAWLDAASFTYYEAPVLVDLYPPSARAYSALHGEGGGTLLRLRGFGMANWAPSDHADADANADADADADAAVASGVLMWQLSFRLPEAEAVAMRRDGAPPYASKLQPHASRLQLCA